ncbi:SLIT1 [Branchiostoma lanceolatum]|uniref:SLIT1 protein n=1 Tax=Branchiostoma lanceolatum TaxID=7740 RepID=A0A8J9ZA90_BRALA|nr:SLIT1 [Branchiostoma lanceolatum]
MCIMATMSISSIPAASLLFLLLTDVITAVVTCPASCRCVGSHVTCHSHLTHVPADAPAQTTWLDLSHNNLRSLDGQTLSNLVHLKRLNLYGNSIHSVADDTFTNLTDLQSVNLGDNRLTYLNPEVFTVLQNLRGVYLSGNPWICDCQLRHLITWVRTSAAVQSGRWGPTCTSPSQLRHTPLAQVDPQTLCPNTTPVNARSSPDKVLTRSRTQLTTMSSDGRLSTMTYTIPSSATSPPTASTSAGCREPDILQNITISDTTVQWQTSNPDVTSVAVTYQVPDVAPRRTRVLHRRRSRFILNGLTQNTPYVICVLPNYRRRRCSLTNTTCVQVKTAGAPDLKSRSVPQHKPGGLTVAGVLAAVTIAATGVLIIIILRQKISRLIHRTCHTTRDNMQMRILPHS